MSLAGAPDDIVRRARQAFVEQLAAEGPALLDAIVEAARVLLSRPSERALAQQRRDNLQGLLVHGADWVRLQADYLVDAAGLSDKRSSTAGALLASMQGTAVLRLVDDATMQRDILTSRLSQAIADHVLWEFNDLRARICSLEGTDELRSDDVFRPQVVARCCVRAFIDAGLDPEAWMGVEPAFKLEMGHICVAAYHDTNRQLIERGILPEVSLRTLIRRTPDSRRGVESRPADNMIVGGTRAAGAPTAFMSPTGPSTLVGAPTAFSGLDRTRGGAGAGVAGGTGLGGAAGDRLPLGPTGRPVVASAESVDATLKRFTETMERHVSGFTSAVRLDQPMSRTLSGALASAQQRLVRRMETRAAEGSVLSPSDLMQNLREEKRALKQSVATPAERATVEIVALLFQSILTEDAIPATIRVWFARLQMPTLRVALSEPDFFSSSQHPARRLIDRMGACVMGFDAAPVGVGPLVEAEIRRIVQVVEAFPETGRKVFQTVLTEFERFLERYFRDQNENTKKGVSLAQQVEHRETLAIQYTIELRKLLDGMPVQDGVRDFLFHVWADVMATVAIRHGQQSAEARTLKETALELVWIGAAKTSREERAQVIGRLAPLLAALRRGMLAGGLDTERQETSLKELNSALTAAFAARAAVIGTEQLARLRARLETLDELLPDADFELDDSFALDLSSHETDELEVIANGGELEPSQEALLAVESLPVGSWYRLEYRDRQDAVQLAWTGLRRQLWLFASTSGRCVLFQKKRLAAFLQAGLLLPAQDESLTVAATREAIEKINADPSRLLEVDLDLGP
jgi:hypothetical protein